MQFAVRPIIISDNSLMNSVMIQTDLCNCVKSVMHLFIHRID